MPSEVVCSPLAVADLDATWEWLAIDNDEPSAADRTVKAILDRMDAVATFPLASTPLDSVCQIRSDWRFVSERGYLVFFRVTERRVFVDRVLSGKSDYLRKLFGVEDGTSSYL